MLNKKVQTQFKSSQRRLINQKPELSLTPPSLSPPTGKYTQPSLIPVYAISEIFLNI